MSQAADKPYQVGGRKGDRPGGRGGGKVSGYPDRRGWEQRQEAKDQATPPVGPEGELEGWPCGVNTAGQS